MKIFAHRGFSSIAPENTMAAFERAIAIKANGIETDVHLCKDGKIVICHDEKVNRTTNGSGHIKDYTWEELQALDAGSWFSPEFSRERIPSLEHLLNLVGKTDLLVNMELKTETVFYPQIEEKVLDLIKKYDFVDRVLISSFNFKSLLKVKAILPEIATAAIMKHPNRITDFWTKIGDLKVTAIHPCYLYLTTGIIDEARKRGLHVNTWTPNQPEKLKDLLKIGTHGVITDFPERAQQILWEEQKINT